MLQEFERIIEERGWANCVQEEILKRVETRLKRRLPAGVPLALTALQKQAIETPGFWHDDWHYINEPQHLMVQGATSAGKTLLSELNVIDVLKHGQKAIVLVPLKAMVHERSSQFREDISGQTGEYKIFASSADHLEHDEQIIAGNYDVAVIVYEKFFAMLSQGARGLMENCGLLVVDELSMLSKEQRGPKLEMALEIVRFNYPMTRIMCIATCDCKTDIICRWLGIRPETRICSAKRPVALEEHIIKLNGKGVYRTIPSNCETDAEIAPQEETLEVPGYNADGSPQENEKQLLLAVLKKVQQTTDNARTLVFVNSRKGAEQMADFLRKNIGELGVSAANADHSAFLEKLHSCDPDDSRQHLINELIPCGIAYHHSGMSTTLRELIESEFVADNSALKVIVATETLTVGVNMPFDVMIMVNSKVPRGSAQPVALSNQEYRNYIGRVGRLGQSNRPGVSYLFVDSDQDRDKYWCSYTEREEVLSALHGATAAELAPYYLSLLINRRRKERNKTNFTSGDLLELFHNSLSEKCGTKAFQPEDMHKSLYRAWLVSDSIDDEWGRDFDEATGRDDESDAALNAREKQYSVQAFGSCIAPYALSCSTCIRIYRTFCEGYKNNRFPANTPRIAIENDWYLLEILYHICLHPEIADSSVLLYPADSRNAPKERILSCLDRLLAEENEDGTKKNILWCDGKPEAVQQRNHLWLLLNSNNLPDEAQMLQAAMRAILLLYWTKGLTAKQIHAMTKFVSFTNGDIERLAEAVSFHLDAICESLRDAWNTETRSTVCPRDTLQALHTLQSRVKYGVSNDLVQLANKHIYGLDRARLLALKKIADEQKLTPMQFLYVASNDCFLDGGPITLAQRRELQEAIERRRAVDKFDMLLNIIGTDAGSALDDAMKTALRALAEWNGEDKRDVDDAFEKLESSLGDLTVSGCGSARWKWSFGDKSLAIGIYQDHRDERDIASIKEFFSKSQNRLLLVSAKCDRPAMLERMAEFHCATVVDTAFLACVLANSISLSLDGGEALLECLCDLRGTFTQSEHSHCTLSHYIRHREDADGKAPRFRLLVGDDSAVYSYGPVNGKGLENALAKDAALSDFTHLSWGSSLRSINTADVPTVILLKRHQVVRSDSLYRFLLTMQQQNSNNCVLLVCTETERDYWENSLAEAADAGGEQAWNSRLACINKVLATDVDAALDAIRAFLSKWEKADFLIGVSYAHREDLPVGLTSADFETDISLLDKLVDQLRDKYGEHRIFYDKYPTAKSVFPLSGGQDASLAAYRKCKVSLVLWNYWATQSPNCREEQKVIFEQCRRGEAKCILLQNHANTDNPGVPADLPGTFPASLDEGNIAAILDAIHRECQPYA